MPKCSFKNNLFFSIWGWVNILHQLTQVYPNHHATQTIVLAVTQCVGRTTHNLCHTMHHVDPTIDEFCVLAFFRVKNYCFPKLLKIA